MVRELAAQPADDLLGRVAPAEIFLHLAAQLDVGHELGRLGAARTLIRQRVRRRRAIPTRRARVAGQLPTDRRRAASQPPGDRPHRLTTSPRDRDLFPLRKRQAPTLEVAPAARTHTTLCAQPPSSHHPMGTRFGRRVGDELTARHRRPELLHNLSDHPLRKLRHHAPPFTLPAREPRGPRLPARQRADRRSRLALGLGYATTGALLKHCLLYTSPSPRDRTR